LQKQKSDAENLIRAFSLFIKERRDDTENDLQSLNKMINKNIASQINRTEFSTLLSYYSQWQTDPRPIDFDQTIPILQQFLQKTPIRSWRSTRVPVEVQNALLEFKRQLQLSISIDEGIIDEIEKLSKTVGLYKIKAGLINSFFAHLKGIKRAAATADNFVFGGNPGTGKTTTARIVGKLLVLLGFINKPSQQLIERMQSSLKNEEDSSGKDNPEKKQEEVKETIDELPFINEDGISISKDYSDYVIVASKETFVAPFEGQSERKTVRVLISAVGKLLFIDEAYSIVAGKNDEFGMAILNTLVNWIPELGDERQVIFAVAGYFDRLRTDFFRNNQGLSSRFPNVFYFPNYTPPQLAEIFSKTIESGGWNFVIGKIILKDNYQDWLLERYAEISESVELELEQTYGHYDMPEIQEPVLTSSENSTRGSSAARFLIHFFDVFSRIFETGNVRKLQNFIDTVSKLWMEDNTIKAIADLSSENSLDEDWLDSLKLKITPSLMLDAIESMLVDLYAGFDNGQEADKPEQLRSDDQVDKFLKNLSKDNPKVPEKLEEIRQAIAKLSQQLRARDILSRNTTSARTYPLQSVERSEGSTSSTEEKSLTRTQRLSKFGISASARISGDNGFAYNAEQYRDIVEESKIKKLYVLSNREVLSLLREIDRRQKSNIVKGIQLSGRQHQDSRVLTIALLDIIE